MNGEREKRRGGGALQTTSKIYKVAVRFEFLIEIILNFDLYVLDNI